MSVLYAVDELEPFSFKKNNLAHSYLKKKDEL